MNWYLVDATDLVLGRMASRVAMRLKGKDSPNYRPNLPGDSVVVINADKVYLTKDKLNTKKYYRHTGYPGGIKEATVKQRLEGPRPAGVIEDAVRRMLSKGPLQRIIMKNLKVYAGSEHPHAGQNPTPWYIGEQNVKNKRRA